MEIEMRNVSKSFGKITILKNVNLKLNSGKWLSIIGPSGAGKTTILNLMSGLLELDDGEILIGNIDDKVKRRGLVGYLLQDFPLYPSLSVKKNLKLAEKKNFQSAGPSFTDVIDLFNLERYLDHYPSTLSGGEKQRVALARTLLLHRPIVLLDEPFSNIDVYMRRDIRRYCRTIQKDWSFTVILVTHDQEDTMSTSDLVAFLDNSTIVQLDTPEKMFRSPVSRKVGDNFGDVGMTLIPGKLLSQNQNSQMPYQYTNTLYGFRESDFDVSNTLQKGFWNVKVLKCEYLGSRYRYFVKYHDVNFSIVTQVKLQRNGKYLWITPKVQGSRLQLDDNETN